MSEWIRTMERLPERGVYVLVYDRCLEDQFVACRWLGAWTAYADHADVAGYNAVGDTFQQEDVTHWMPLPVPPAPETPNDP